MSAGFYLTEDFFSRIVYPKYVIAIKVFNLVIKMTFYTKQQNIV